MKSSASPDLGCYQKDPESPDIPTIRTICFTSIPNNLSLVVMFVVIAMIGCEMRALAVSFFLLLAGTMALHACETRVATPSYFAAGDAEIIQLLHEVSQDDGYGRCFNFLTGFQASEIMEMVARGNVDYGILSASRLTNTSIRLGVSPDELNVVMKSQVGFAYASAAEMVEAAREELPGSLQNIGVTVLAVLPSGTQVAMWKTSDWDGDFRHPEAEYDRIFIGPSTGFPDGYERFFERALSHSPHVLIGNSNAIADLSGDAMHWLAEVGDEFTDSMAAIVDGRSDSVFEDLASEGLQSMPVAGNVIGSPESSVQRFLDLLDGRDPPLAGLQCASGTCSCAGSNSCSTKCCG